MMKGKVQTVLGLVDPDSLGRVLTHEHLLHELKKSVFKTPPPSLVHSSNFDKLSMENLGAIHRYPYSCDTNMEFADNEVAGAIAEEMKNLKTIGIGTVVENSSIGLRGKNQSSYLKKLSQESGINIIAGTGYYVADAHESSTLAQPQEILENTISKDITDGINGNGVKCGVIGEIGCSWPLHSFEKKVLKSAASVQQTLKCPVIIHPGRNKDSPEEIMHVFLEAGGCAGKTVMSHLERTLLDEVDLAEFATSAQCICEFDLFGIEVSHYQLNENVDMPSDAQRIKLIRYLIGQGFEDMIVISHDIHTKHRLKRFGGHGYSHISMNVVPKMLNRGISTDLVDKILIHNPKRWLTFC